MQRTHAIQFFNDRIARLNRMKQGRTKDRRIVVVGIDLIPVRFLAKCGDKLTINLITVKSAPDRTDSGGGSVDAFLPSIQMSFRCDVIPLTRGSSKPFFLLTTPVNELI